MSAPAANTLGPAGDHHRAGRVGGQRPRPRRGAGRAGADDRALTLGLSRVTTATPSSRVRVARGRRRPSGREAQPAERPPGPIREQLVARPIHGIERPRASTPRRGSSSSRRPDDAWRARARSRSATMWVSSSARPRAAAAAQLARGLEVDPVGPIAAHSSLDAGALGGHGVDDRRAPRRPVVGQVEHGVEVAAGLARHPAGRPC